MEWNKKRHEKKMPKKAKLSTSCLVPFLLLILLSGTIGTSHMALWNLNIVYCLICQYDSYQTNERKMNSNIYPLNFPSLTNKIMRYALYYYMKKYLLFVKYIKFWFYPIYILWRIEEHFNEFDFLNMGKISWVYGLKILNSNAKNIL